MTLASRRTLLAVSMIALGLAACSNTEGPVSASTTSHGDNKADLTARSEAALNELYAKTPATRQLGEKAKAILVFPGILKAGAQEFSQAYFFNTAEALKTFRETKGFQGGAGASAVAADFGANAALTSATLQKPVVVATWGQAGLMAGATIEGAKITEINP